MHLQFFSFDMPNNRQFFLPPPYNIVWVALVKTKQKFCLLQTLEDRHNMNGHHTEDFKHEDRKTIEGKSLGKKTVNFWIISAHFSII